MIARGQLEAIRIGRGVRVLPESVRAAEAGPLAVRPGRRKGRQRVPKEIEELLG
jgi:hypothetical protein